MFCSLNQGGLPPRLGGGSRPQHLRSGGQARQGYRRLQREARRGRQLPVQPPQEGASSAVRRDQSTHTGTVRFVEVRNELPRPPWRVLFFLFLRAFCFCDDSYLQLLCVGGGERGRVEAIPFRPNDKAATLCFPPCWSSLSRYSFASLARRPACRTFDPPDNLPHPTLSLPYP